MISNQTTSAGHLLDFEILHIISDKIVLHSVQLSLLINNFFAGREKHISEFIIVPQGEFI